MFTSRSPRSFVLRLGAAALALAASGAALAASHALILHNTYEGSPLPAPIRVGDQQACPPGASSCLGRLPFARKDAQIAVQMALAMGVPRDNIKELANAALDLRGLRRAFADLARTVRYGDSVFIYYSGHGGRDRAPGRVGSCQESITAFEGADYLDEQFTADLNAVAAKAGRIVMVNDSCHSGGVFGVVSKDSRGPGLAPRTAVAKSGPIYAKASAEEGRGCREAVNKGGIGESMRGLADSSAGRVLYVAAAQHDEVSWGDERGSYATLAMMQCISPRVADTNRSGTVDAQEFKVCTQRVMTDQFLTAQGLRQTITLRGDTTLPLFFGQTEAAPSRPLDAQGIVQDITQAAQKDKTLYLEAERSSYPIVSSAEQRRTENQMRFTVKSPKAGYLYLFQIKARKGDGSQSIIQLFPNALDDKNQVQADTHSIPAENKRNVWAIAADGPVGKSQMIALVSEQPLNVNRLLPASDGTFRSGETGTDSTLAGKAAPISLLDRYWVSNVISVQETR